ncbi:hypothetical protein [Paenibacillus campinasensis]|uniref:Uncharacterized protein n=1 Tax=Paenibacillus campinasensis TaxID=66347 RepID=A0A268EIG9_9BACL|nr:hypothetical protein [Paenibacillus campinasensis]PAD72874.1 hypothetical protein CHH67_21450 [Paenibacillus campinasensis]
MNTSKRAADKRRTIVFSRMSIVDMLDRSEMKSLRDHVIAGIEASEPGTILCLDLFDINWINSSAVDEVIGKALAHLRKSKLEVFLYLQIENNSFEHFFNIERALRDADLPLMVNVNNRSFALIGPLQSYLKDFLFYVYSRGQTGVTSAIASIDLAINKHKCSTYLGKLFDLRLIIRVKQTTQVGYEYIYYPLFGTDLMPPAAGEVCKN